MHEVIRQELWRLIMDDCKAHDLPVIWKPPIVKFADAQDPGFLKLRELVAADHYLPQEYLPGAKTVLSYFLPFLPEIGQSNVAGERNSNTWADAYVETNAVAARVNEKLARFIKETLGYDAVVPFNAGMLGRDDPRSRWSQRHVAYLAGQGTFGKNNMLISDAGCVGRYYSMVTKLPAAPDPVARQERCLFKRDGSCGACIKRCAAGALTENGFDRFRCMEQCLKNEQWNQIADVCGKCVVGLPCSHTDPTA